MKTKEDVFKLISNERVKQDRKWGQQNHNLTTWMAILTEEVGEASKEAVDFHCKNTVKDWRGVNVPPTHAQQLERLQSYEKELIQAAAVIVQMIESLNRNEIPSIINETKTNTK